VIPYVCVQPEWTTDKTKETKKISILAETTQRHWQPTKPRGRMTDKPGGVMTMNGAAWYEEWHDMIDDLVGANVVGVSS
jgi:hypothetical protein